MTVYHIGYAYLFDEALAYRDGDYRVFYPGLAHYGRWRP